LVAAVLPAEVSEPLPVVLPEVLAAAWLAVPSGVLSFESAVVLQAVLLVSQVELSLLTKSRNSHKIVRHRLASFHILDRT
jgi:hypothetical protein